MRVTVHAIESEPLGQNAYVVWADGQPDAVVVDPGFEPERILNFLNQAGLGVAAVLLTHGHVDHIAGVPAFREVYPAVPLAIGAGDAPMLIDPVLNLSLPLLGVEMVVPAADVLLADGQTVEYAGVAFEVRHIPGHSPGHVVYVVHAAEPVAVLGGDVLFAGGVGRTDFPGGSEQQLLAGIRAKLWPLPDAARVFPGHGPPTTVGHEKRTNPFLRCP